jgi:spore coat protein A
MKMTRRKFLKLGLVGGAGLALSAGALGACQTVRTPRSSPLVVPFRVPLPIPPVLEPVRSDGTTDHYEITQ